MAGVFGSRLKCTGFDPVGILEQDPNLLLLSFHRCLLSLLLDVFHAAPLVILCVPAQHGFSPRMEFLAQYTLLGRSKTLVLNL